MSSEDAIQALTERVRGLARTGKVYLKDFDNGVVITLGAEIIDDNFYLPVGDGSAVPGVCPPPGSPGIPIVFGNPDQQFEEERYPMILVTRGDFTPAMNRWSGPRSYQYRAPAPGALRARVEPPNRDPITGWTRYEMLPQAIPYDISYDVRVMGAQRGGYGQSSPRTQAGTLFQHVMSIYQPYTNCGLWVQDTIGDWRTYEVFNENTSTEDELIEVTVRQIGFRLSLRVEGELDLNAETEHPAVTQQPTIRSSQHG